MVENAEDEMSFEVRQSELVMGGQGAGDQEHSGAVALNALSDLIIGALLHSHISLSVFIVSNYLCLFCLSPVSSVCMLCFIHCELLYLEI